MSSGRLRTRARPDPTATSTCAAGATRSSARRRPGRSARSRAAAARSWLLVRCRASTGRRSTTPYRSCSRSCRRLAQEQRFEDAARLRDRITALEHVARRGRPARTAACARRLRCRAGRRRRADAASSSRRVRSSACGRSTVRTGVEWQAGPRRRRPRRTQPGGRDDRRAARDRRLPAAPAARARGGVPTLPGMDELRERGAGDGWRKLVADGVTATPVTLRRGAAVKLVDGANTEIVPRSGLARAARRDPRRRAKRPRPLTRRRRARAPQQARSVARLACARIVSRSRLRHARPRDTARRCRRTIRSSRRRRSRATRSGRCSTTSSCCARLPLWQRDRIRVVDAGCGKAYMSLALVAYGREVGTRVELVGLDANPGVIATVRGIAERLGYDEARFEATTIQELRRRRPGRPARLAARLRHRERRGDRGRRQARRRGDRRRAVLPPRARRATRQALEGRRPAPRRAARPPGRPRHRRARAPPRSRPTATGST